MTATGATGATAPIGAKNTASASGMGNISEQKDMFLKLLVAQLKNQDPSSPMDQKDMMAQMAQFTSVEQLTNMVKAMETMTFNATFSQSVGLIGKTVEYGVWNGETNMIETASVSAVSSAAGEIKLVLDNGRSINPGDVVKVTQ